MYDISNLIWIFTMVSSATLVLATASIMMRNRRHYRWLTLLGAILFSGASIFSTIYMTLLILGRVGWNGEGARWQDWLETNSYISGSGQIAFLLGIFLNALRRTGESDRIAELEAILLDRQQDSDPR